MSETNDADESENTPDEESQDQNQYGGGEDDIDAVEQTEMREDDEDDEDEEDGEDGE